MGADRATAKQDQTLNRSTRRRPSAVRSFISDLRTRDWLAFVILLVGLVALLVYENSNQATVKEFIDNHQLLAAVGTASLLSLLTVLGVDALRAHWEAQKWRNLSNLAMLSIAFDVTVVLDVHIWLVTGTPPRSSFTPPGLTQRKLTLIRSRMLLPVNFDSDYSKVDSAEYEKSLRELARSKQWLRLAIDEIDRHKAEHRRRIALWIPSMTLNPDANEVLERVVALNERISDVQDELRKALKNDNLPPLISAWTALMDESMTLREDLWKASREPQPEWQEFRRILRSATPVQPSLPASKTS